MAANQRNVWSSVPNGTIVDEDIQRLADAGALITADFERSCVKQACYELRAGDVCYETSADRENKRVTIGADGYVLRPHTYVTVITKEKIELPDNVMARILTKGQLFSVGIMPVSTYADPGFSGRLGITLCNASHRHIVIRLDQAIAKIEFSILSRPVSRPYSGQHGYETQIWPIPVQLYADEAMLARAGIAKGSRSEIATSYGPVVADLHTRLRYYEHKVWLQIGITIISFAIIIGIAGTIGAVWALVLGVAANLTTSLVLKLVADRTAKN